jgi:hypothetical protein
MFHHDFHQAQIEALLSIMQCMPLTNLSLGHSKFTGESLRMLADWPGLARIHALGFSFDNLGDEGVAILAASANLSNLRWLQLNGNNLSDRSADILAKNPVLRQLRWLGLDRISPCGLEVLGQSTCLPSLEVVTYDDPKGHSSSERSVQWLQGRFRQIALVPQGTDSCWWDDSWSRAASL